MVLDRIVTILTIRKPIVIFLYGLHVQYVQEKSQVCNFIRTAFVVFCLEEKAVEFRISANTSKTKQFFEYNQSDRQHAT